LAAETVIGKTKDGEDVSGSINIPEVAHDTEEDEYVVRSLDLSADFLLFPFPAVIGTNAAVSSSRLRTTPMPPPSSP
jgi:hypothetical protein